MPLYNSADDYKIRLKPTSSYSIYVSRNASADWNWNPWNKLADEKGSRKKKKKREFKKAEIYN